MVLRKSFIFIFFLNLRFNSCANIPKEIIEKYQNAAQKCLKETPISGAVYSKDTQEYKCEPLLQSSRDLRGICRNTEWLILQNNRKFGLPTPACAERPCDGARYLIPFGSHRGECVQICSTKLCGNGEIVRSNVFGFGNFFTKLIIALVPHYLRPILFTLRNSLEFQNGEILLAEYRNSKFYHF